MPSTFSPLKIQLMATGENNTTWGDVTNLNLGTALEEAIVGSADVTFASADVTLTLTDTNASQTARNMRLRCTGTTGGSTRNLIVPSIEKPYIVKNDCADSVVVKTAAGTGITVPAGKTMWVYTDATNVVDAVTHLSSLTLGTDLAVSDGGTGASTFTANGVIYGNTTSALLATAAGTTGQVLVGNTGGAPSWATLTGIGVTSFSAGTTGLTPNTATTGAITLGGTLGVANGGTGTATAFTAGSVVFAGASGVYSQDNANLFWDNANDRLGIGTATPTVKLDVAGGVNNTGAFRSISGGVDAIFGAAQFASGVVGIGSVSNHPITFNTNLTENMRITTAGNVGIGTSSPVTRLTVDGGAASLRTGNQFRFYPTANNNYSQIYNPTGGQMAFDSGAGEAMRIDGSSNVGIGTSSPASFGKLATITSTGSTALYAGTSTQGVFVRANDSTRIVQFMSSGSLTGGFSFSNGLTDNLTIDVSGNVGIGTSSPQRPLHVYYGSAVTGAYGAIVQGYVGGYGAGVSFQSQLSGGSLAEMARITADGEDAWNTTASTQDAGLRFYTSLDGTVSEKMRINSSGLVGIGTSSPGGTYGKLTVAGGVRTVDDTSSKLEIGRYSAGAPNSYIKLGPNSASLRFTDAGDTADLMTLTNAGNLGIGTSSPTAKITVYNSGSGDAAVRIGNAQNGLTTDVGKQGATGYGATSAGDGFLYSSGTLSIMSDNGAGVIKFSAGGNTERMRIDASGNLLVGTTSGSGGIAGAAPRLVVEPPNTSTHGVILKSLGQSYDVGLIWNTAASGDNRFFEFGTDATYTARGSISYNRAGGLVAYNTTSDYRAKDIIGPVTDAGTTIDALKVYNGTMKGATIERPMLIAHEAQEIVPYAVTGEKDAVNEDGTDKHQQMDHQILIPLLIAEIQSLRARVAQLEGN